MLLLQEVQKQKLKPLKLNQKRYCKFNPKNTLSNPSCHKNLSIKHFDKHLVSSFLRGNPLVYVNQFEFPFTYIHRHSPH